MQLGRTYLDAGKRTEAQQTFNRLVDEYPDSPFNGGREEGAGRPEEDLAALRHRASWSESACLRATRTGTTGSCRSASRRGSSARRCPGIGHSSTMSQPTTRSPTRSRAAAAPALSYHDRPPGSGVPVAGMIAGSKPSHVDRDVDGLAERIDDAVDPVRVAGAC